MAEQKVFGETGAELTACLFDLWRAFGEHKDRRRLQREMAPLTRQLRTLLERAGRKSTHTRHHRGFANNLLKIWPALWTFVTAPGVEPTNYPEVRVMPRLEAERRFWWAVWLAKLGIIRALGGRREACRAAGSGRAWCGVGRCGRALVA